MTTTYWVIGILTWVILSPVQAEAWNADLEGRGAVRIDPQTYKPVYIQHSQALWQQGDSSTPLWDGVHKLDDGSTITVRAGVVVPNETMYQAWSSPPQTAESPSNACENLMRLVCGANGGCSRDKPCELAKQLHHLQSGDAAAESGNDKKSACDLCAYDECQQALLDKITFPDCSKDLPTPAYCTQLVEQTCGAKMECGKTPACSVAQQLLQLARDADSTITTTVGDSSSVGQPATSPSDQCQEALTNTFFSVCASNATKHKPQ